MMAVADQPKSWLVLGLGNPGPEYERTRHNAGFMVVDRLAARLGGSIKRQECRSLVGRVTIGNFPVELVKPQTYMNLSGEAAACLVSKEEREACGLVVITDDLALPLGRIRLRPKGSHGGHNGLRSIADCLRTQEFIRLRIGIKPEHPVVDTKNFVLQRFAKAEEELLENALADAESAIEDLILDGIEKAMSRWNADSAVKVKPEEPETQI